MTTTTKPRTEIWKAQTKSTVWVYVYDRRKGEYVPTRVGGRQGRQQLQITVDEREYNQERIPPENRHLDPFTNGRLVRVDAATDDTIVTDEDLMGLLGERHEDRFRELALAIEDELTMRRLLELAAVEGSMVHVTVLRDIVDERYSVAKSQRSVLEMQAGPQGIGDEVVHS